MLFQDIKFYITPSFPPQRLDTLVGYLTSNGAEKSAIEDASHVIADSIRFEGSANVKDGAAVVSADWVERSMVLGKLQEPKFYSPDPRKIFSGVILCTTDLDNNDNEVIAAGVEALGGQFRAGLTRDCTHLLAPCSGSPKYAAAMHFQRETRIHVLLPHWFDACFRLVTRLDEKPYEWPQPEILKSAKAAVEGQDASKKRVHLPSERKSMIITAIASDAPDGKVPMPTGSSAVLPSSSPAKNAAGDPSSSTSGMFINVWQGRRIFLSSDLRLSPERRETVENALTRAGATIIPLGPLGYDYNPGAEDAEGDEPMSEEAERVVEDRETEEEELVEQADVVIMSYRSGKAYVKALRMGKIIGTLAWLFHVNKTGAVSSPLNQILHFPMRKAPVDKFDEHIITITNYTGEARDYLKKLITLMGATFTPSLTAKNTVVIAAHVGGSKTEKAREWDIPVVNHIWIEDCFVQWRKLSCANSKYVDFPPGALFAKEVGGRAVEGLDDSAGIEKECEKLEKETRKLRERREARRREKREEEEKKRQTQALKDHHSSSQAEVVVPHIKDVTNESRGQRIARKDAHDEPTKDTDIEDDRVSVRRGRSRSRVKRPVDIDAPAARTRSQSRVRARSRGRGRPAKENTDGEENEDLRNIEEDASVNRSSQSRSQSQSQPKRRGRPPKRIPIDDDQPTEHGPSKNEVDRHLDTPASRTRSKSRARARRESPDSARPVRRGRSASRTRASFSRNHSHNKSLSQASRSPTPISISDDDADAGTVRTTRNKASESASKKAKERADALAKEISVSPSMDLLKQKRSPTKTYASRMKGKSSPAKPANNTLSSRVALPEKLDSDSDEEGLSPLQANGSSFLFEAGGRNTKDGGKPTKTTNGKKIERITLIDSEAESESSKKPAMEVTKTGPPQNVTRSVASSSKVVAGTSTPTKKILAKQPSFPGPSPNKIVTVELTHVATSASTLNSNTVQSSAERTTPSLPQRKSAHSRSFSAVAGEVVITDSPKRGRPPRKPSTEPSIHEEEEEEEEEEAGPRVTQASTSHSRMKPSVDPVKPVETLISTESQIRSRRTAAARAEQKLRDEVMPDALRFAKEMKSGHIKGSWEANAKGKGKEEGERGGKKRKESSQEDDEALDDAPREVKKRRVSGPDNKKQGKRAREETDSQISREISVEAREERDMKSQKLTHNTAKPTKQKEIQLMTTQVQLSDSTLKALQKLGVKMASKPTSCTHLIVDHIARTEKFLCAMSSAPLILTKEWALDSANAKQLLPEDDYLLVDEEGEKKFGFKLSDALRRARIAEKKLLDGHTFFITPKVENVDLLSKIIKSAGGKIESRAPTIKLLNGYEDVRHLISCEADSAQWRPFAEKDIPVYMSEVIFSGVLTQRMQWKNESFRVDGSLEVE